MGKCRDCNHVNCVIERCGSHEGCFDPIYIPPNVNTRQPRFSEAEREALETVLHHADCDLEMRWGRINLEYPEHKGFIGTVRKMLGGAE